MGTDRIKEAAALFSGQDRPGDQNGSARSIGRIVITVLVVVGLAWLLLVVVRDLIIYGLYFRYVDELAAKTGLNKYLINVLAAAGLAPFLLGVKYYFFSLKRDKRTRGAALLLGMTVVYNLALFAATKDNVIGRFYAITPDGVKYSDSALDDGREWLKVTRDNMWYVTRLAVGKRVDAAGHDWFDQKSGLPMLWYSKLDNQILFYDGPGFDRFTAEPLKAGTKDLYLEWKRSAQSRTPAAPPSSANLRLDPSVVKLPCPTGATCVQYVAPVGNWSALYPIRQGFDFATDTLGAGKPRHQIEYTFRDGRVLVQEYPTENGKRVSVGDPVAAFRFKSLENEPVIIEITLTPIP